MQHTNCKSGTIYFTATLLHKSDILCLFSVKDEFIDYGSELDKYVGTASSCTVPTTAKLTACLNDTSLTAVFFRHGIQVKLYEQRDAAKRQTYRERERDTVCKCVILTKRVTINRDCQIL